MMTKKYKWSVLVAGLTLLYGLAYFIFTQTATGKPFWGAIPEVFIYLFPVYFISSLFIEMTLAESYLRKLTLAFQKSCRLLIFLILYAGIYSLFSKYIFVPYQLKDSLWGDIADMTLLFFMVFFIMKLVNKSDAASSR